MESPFLEVRVLLGRPGRLYQGEGHNHQSDNGNVVAIQQALQSAFKY
jgi:hypothetical protein